LARELLHSYFVTAVDRAQAYYHYIKIKRATAKPLASVETAAHGLDLATLTQLRYILITLTTKKRE